MSGTEEKPMVIYGRNKKMYNHFSTPVYIFIFIACFSVKIRDVITRRVTVSVTRQFGQLGRLSVLRCTIHPPDVAIKFIRWVKGDGDNVYVYFPATNNEALRTGPMGRYTNREVKGLFNATHYFHELSIFHTKQSDQDRYYCQLRDTNFTFYQDFVNLKAVVPPDIFPSVAYQNGTKLIESTGVETHNSSEIIIAGKMSFICAVGASNPPPSIQWKTDSKECILIHHMVANKTRQYGVELKGLTQWVDICPGSYNGTWLNCTIAVPDPRSGNIQTRHMSLKLTNKKGTHMLTLNVTAILQTVAEVVVIALLLLSFRGGKSDSSYEWIRLSILSSCIEWIFVTFLLSVAYGLNHLNENNHRQFKSDVMRILICSAVSILPAVHCLSTLYAIGMLAWYRCKGSSRLAEFLRRKKKKVPTATLR